jgi:NAD(P)-dependent dehydrogenase (short-subunit alcohol dehydrogenase family)
VITGAAQGHGPAIAAALAHAGARLAVVGQGVTSLARSLRNAGGLVLAMDADLTSSAELDEMVARTVKAFGRIDILVNNADMDQGSEFQPEELPHDIWNRVLDTNLNGAFFCTQAIGRQMIAQGHGGRVIHIASISGLVVNRVRDKHPLAYCVSQAGIIMLTKVLAVEWAQYRIGVNAIAPGYFQGDTLEREIASPHTLTADIPMQRLGGPQDLAGAVMYLASDASSFVTGHVLLVDGGYTVW